MADPISTGLQSQLGLETTQGTPVPGNKLFPSMTFDLDPDLPIFQYTGTGRRFPSVAAPTGEEMAKGKLGGPMTFQELEYALAMAFGAPVFTTPTNGIVARQSKWIVPLTGRINPKAFTLEQGDADDSERFPGMVATGLGWDVTRKDGKLSGELLAFPLQKNGASGFAGMTGSPTALANVPIISNTWQLYLDPTSANIGTTLITAPFHFVFNISSLFSPYFVLNSAVVGPQGVADIIPKGSFNIEALKSPLTGQAETWWSYARGGSKVYVRFKSTGPLLDNYQILTVTGTPTGGTFLLTYKGQSATIQWNSTTAQTQTALQALSTIGTNNCLVTGGTLPGATQTITMAGTLANDATLITVGTNSLTGGASPTPTLGTSTQIPYSLTADMCGAIDNPTGTKNFEGARSRDVPFAVMEDAGWASGQAIVLTLVNTLAAL